LRGHFLHLVWQHNPALHAPARYRRACEYDAFVPLPLADLRLTLPGDVAGIISEAEKAVVALNHVAGAELMPLARLLLRTESIASSKVEGMQVDARTLARAEANQEIGRRIGSDATEILANIDAMQLAVDRASSLEGIRPQDLVDIHRVLLQHAPNSNIAGRLRTSQNWIGGNDYNPCGAAFVPPPAEEVERLLEDLCRFSNDDELPALVQAAIAHAQFETIHPFDDGNGRTGRALVQVILRRRGLAPTFVPPISVILAREKERYIKGLALFREDRIPEWLEIFAVATSRAAGLAVRYSKRVADLQEGWRQQLREHSNPRSDSAAWAIINILPAHPIVTVPVAVAATKRVKSAVTTAVAQLNEAGVLQPLSAATRNRAWEADGLLDLVVKLESGAE
jgi:Fic family protein